MVRLFVSVVCSVWGPLPCPDSEQAGLELVRGLCDIWTGGILLGEVRPQRCVNRLKIGEKIEKSEAPISPMC